MIPLDEQFESLHREEISKFESDLGMSRQEAEWIEGRKSRLRQDRPELLALGGLDVAELEAMQAQERLARSDEDGAGTFRRIIWATVVTVGSSSAKAPSCQGAGAGIWSANTWVRSGVVMGSSSTILPSARP